MSTRKSLPHGFPQFASLRTAADGQAGGTRTASTGNVVLRRRDWLRLLLIALISSVPGSGWAQVGPLGGLEPGSSYPSAQYYLALDTYRTGDLETASEQFDLAMGQTRRSVKGQWIDSIPVHAMRAECAWHAGDLVTCRESIDRAFQIAIQYRGWLAQPEWDTALQGNVVLANEPGLWPEAAAVQRVPLRQKMSFQSGSLLTQARLLQGGAIEEPNIKLVDVVEIMRGLATASYRRRLLMGGLSERDPLVEQLIESTKYPADLQLPLGRSLIGAMRVAERFANSDDSRVVSDADNNALYRGAVHPFTPVVLLCKASALAGSDQPANGIPVAIQAANAAAALGQTEWIGEALQLAAGCATNPNQADRVRQSSETVLRAMNQQSRSQSSRLALLQTSIAGADAAVSANQPSVAETFISTANSIRSRRRVLQPRLNAYLGYAIARLAAAKGEALGVGESTTLDQGLSMISQFAFNQRNRNRVLISIPRIYQLELVRQSIGDTVGGNRGEELLDHYCRETPIDVWRRDPVDALASGMQDRSAAEAAWIELAASGTEARDVLRRIDYVVGSRFLRQLSLGGRIAQVRQLASASDQVQLATGIEFRNNPPPVFAELRQRIAAPAGAGVDSLVAQSKQQESIACQVALDRLELPRVMPPPLSVEDAGSVLPSRTGMLTFFVAGNRLLAVLSADGRSVGWTVTGAQRLPREIQQLLTAIGVGKRGDRLPRNDDWKDAAVKLRERLIPDDSAISTDRFDELIVIPSGPLWYLPMELLPLGDSAGPLLGDAIKIRYAATPGLAIHPVAAPAISRAVGVFDGGIIAPGDIETNRVAVESITSVLTEPLRLPAAEVVPGSLLGSTIGHLFVVALQNAELQRPLSMNVAGYDAGSTAGALSAWIRFPAAAPQSVALAGFRTPVAVGKIGSGDELFMTVCGLQAAGVRDVLISRWPVGGQSTAIVMREFLQELPFTGMSAAWQRARRMLMKSELIPSAEPLLTQAEHKREDLTGNEPLFWASYLVASPIEISKPTAVPLAP